MVFVNLLVESFNTIGANWFRDVQSQFERLFHCRNMLLQIDMARVKGGHKGRQHPSIDAILRAVGMTNDGELRKGMTRNDPSTHLFQVSIDNISRFQPVLRCVSVS